MVRRVKWVLDGDGYPNGDGDGNGIRYKPIGAETGKKIIPAAGMGIDLPDADGDGNGNANTRPAPPRPVYIPTIYSCCYNNI